MKTLTSHKYITAIIAIAVFALIFNGCKKADLKSPSQISNDDAAAMTKIKENVAKQMEHEGGIPQIFTRKQKTTTQWVDQFRKPVTKEQMQNNFTSQCNYDLPAYCDLVQYARVYRCASSSYGLAGYFLQCEYEVSWNNNITKNNGTGVNTSAYFDILDPGGVNVRTVTLDKTNSDVEIVEIGPDPNPSFPNNYIFRVKFVSTDFSDPNLLVPESWINNGSYTINISAVFTTDCKTGGSPYALYSIPVTSYGFTGASGNDPCKRNDKVWGGTGPAASSTWSVTGYSAGGTLTCGFGGSFVATDLQEVQYNVDGGTWLDMDNYTANTTWQIYGSAFLRGSDYGQTVTLPSGHHLVGLRYRNWKYGGTSVPWDIPLLSLGACRSPMNTSLPTTPVNQQEYSTWAYQYWPY